MDIFTTLPIWNGSSKQIKMMDSNDKSVGFIQQKFKNLFDQCMHCLDHFTSLLRRPYRGVFCLLRDIGKL